MMKWVPLTKLLGKVLCSHKISLQNMVLCLLRRKLRGGEP